MPSDSLPLVDVSEIIRLVDEPSFGRGREYARGGAVQKLEWVSASGTLTGTVKGSAKLPYHCAVELVESRKGFHRPLSSYCSCPMSFGCKHVAATLLESNAQHLQQMAGELSPSQLATGPRFETLATAPVSTEPSWKTTVAALAGAPVAARPADTSRVPLRLDEASTPLALQFELREQTPRTRERWRGPTAKPASGRRVDGATYRLGVRPVSLSSAGNWVRTGLSWSTIAYQTNRMGIGADHQRWFAEFAALHRAARDSHAIYDPDWLYLDDFQSALLWQLLGEGQRLGIQFVGNKKDQSVRVGSLAEVSLDASVDASGANRDLQLTASLSIDGRPFDPQDANVIGAHGVYAFVLPPKTIDLAPTAATLSGEQSRLLGRPAAVMVPAADVAEFVDGYLPGLRRAIRVTSRDATLELPVVAPPVLRLTVSYLPKQTLGLDWAWENSDGSPTNSLENAILVRVERALEGSLVHGTTEPVTLRGLDAAEFASQVLPKLTGLDGVRVDEVGERPDYQELLDPPELTFTTVPTDQRDWFDLGVIVTVNGRNVPFAPLFKALSKNQKKILLVDNSYLSLDHPAFDKLRELIEEASGLAEWETGIRISRYQASLWSEFEDLAEFTEQAVAWRTAVSGLLSLSGVDPSSAPPVPLPPGVHATLRPYQQDGFDWLVFLWENQLGGVLADDMGLGKTLQTLALISHAVSRRTASGTAQAPFLVVAPTSVVGNWVAEAHRFAPGLSVAAVTATEAKSGRTIADLAVGADVVVTSYALFRLDFAAYQKLGWAGLILDEAQFVKNHTSRAAECARELDAPFKLAITGTPMENSLLDLWSLFQIVAPGLFPSLRKFTEGYVRPVGKGDRADLVAKLRRRIRPLMMRRTKDLVAKDLPAKQEQVLQIDLTPRHRKIYDMYLQRERQKLLGLVADLDKNRFIVFRSLTLLRMLSLDASLVDPAYSSVPSSKLDALFEQLEDVVAEGHRALIFSQFTSFLKKTAARLDEQGIEYCYLDGSTLHRADVISRFKDGAAPVFLISLKAGGFGLNLTEADYVFMLDPWWNPASESQAIDRTHRIGQTKNVMVYRMVARGTIEEKVMALKAQKSLLFDAVMDDDAAFSTALTADDIRGLLED